MTTMKELHDTLHRQVWDLIPWVAAGSASDADRQHVHQHLPSCDDCRQEMAFHQALVQGMHSHSTEALDDADADAALQRLWAQLDRQASAAALPATQVAPVSKVASVAAAGGGARWLVAAVLVQAVGLAALAGLLVHSWRTDAYQTLTAPALATGPVAQLHLVPAASMTMGRLSQMMAQHGLQIVASNHDGTVLSLSLTAPASASSADTVQALAARLRTEPGVRLAEPNAAAIGR
jgi:hypothetical protein